MSCTGLRGHWITRRQSPQERRRSLITWVVVGPLNSSSEGESACVATTDLVVLERTLKHNSPANSAERAIKTLEEQVKVMRLDFEKLPGT